MSESLNNLNLNIIINYDNAPKEADIRKIEFQNVLDLINNEKSDFKDIKISTNKRSKIINLNKKPYSFVISFSNKARFNINLFNYLDDINIINEIINKLINYINVVLGENAKNSNVLILYSCDSTGYEMDLVNSIIDKKLLIEMNEAIKENMNPIAIAFELNYENRDYFISQTMKDKKSSILMGVAHKFDDVIPFDYIKKINNDLNEINNRLKIIKESVLNGK